MINILIRMITWPMFIVLVILEWLLKLGVKICTIAFGLLINILLICMIIAICNRHWESLELLVLFMMAGLVLVYGNATILYLINEVIAYLKRL